MGLLISTLTKNQFAASQAALIVGFLPAFELSGFIFEIDSMPAPIRLLASVLPPRYFVSSMQTLFLAGDVPSVLVPNGLVLVAMAAVLVRRTRCERPGCGWSRPMWLRIRSLIIKELLAVWRDPKGRFVLLVPPVIEMLIFAYAATQEVKNVRIAVLNQDMGIYARDLVARFEGSPEFPRGRPPAAPMPRSRAAIDSRSVLMVVHIRQDFSRELAAGRQARVQLILDGRSSNAAQILGGYAEQIIDGYNAELAQTRRRGRRPASVVVARSGSIRISTPSGARSPAWWPSWSALEGLMVTGLSVARERELGTFEQLLVSPLGPGEIVVGKTVPAFLVGMAEGTLMVTVAVFFFRVPLTGSVALLVREHGRVSARPSSASGSSFRRWPGPSSRRSSARSRSWCR